MTRFQQWMFAIAWGIIGLIALGSVTVFGLMAYDSVVHSPPTIEACPVPKK